MSDPLQIIVTGDGSHSLLNTALNETYHSVHGARRESVHVFITHGLQYFRDQNAAATIRILEVGFGTGMNALLSATFAESHQQQIHYSTIEAFPLSDTILRQLNYSETIDEKKIFEGLHAVSWHHEHHINNFFCFLKVNTTLEQFPVPAAAFDVIYFDAFAPNKQPELWELPMLEKVCCGLVPGGVFVTYCAKGQLKRDLKKLGLDVQTLPGPPGKKEMVRALKIS
jgi:tRNA U34 5-methylaminomethyl-2-thiouridine-forming methyltransferase MnmC